MKSVSPLFEPADPFKTTNWLIVFTGFCLSKQVSYIIYRIIVNIFYVIVHFMILYTLYLVSSDKLTAAGVLHVYAVSSWLLWITASRTATDRSLNKMREMINSGFFTYVEEELDEVQVAKLNSISDEIKWRSDKFLIMCILGVFFGMVVFPATTYFINEAIEENQLINPYLPLPIYYPFSTETALGFSVAYLVDIMFWTYDYSTAVVSNELLINSTVHLKVHFSVLNYSIANIQRRAYKLFAKRYFHEVREASLDQLMETKDFRHCLITCLKANVQHHQAILRFKNICQPYNGLAILNLVTVTTVIYGALLYLLLQDIPAMEMIKCIIPFIAEQSYAFLICYIGEEVINESKDLFESLYRSSWIECNKEFKQTLHIMMSNTIKPMMISAYLLDFSASLKSFSELQSAVYKITNLWRQSDKLS